MVRNTRKCKPFDTQLHRHVRHSQANLARVFASLQRTRFNSFRTGSRGRQNRISRPHRTRQIPAPSRAVGMGSCKTKLQQPAAFNLQIETPTSTKTKEKLQMTDPQVTIAFRVPAHVVQAIDDQRDSWNKSRPDKKPWSRSDMYRWILSIHVEHLNGER